MNAKFLNNLSFQSEVFAIFSYNLGRLGVPIFLFLTGYLLLDRDYTSEKCKWFWRKNWLRLLITTEIWIVIYDVFLRVFHFVPHWQTSKLLKDMFFLTQVKMGHIWYMPMIIGVYLCIPLAARAIQKLDIKVLTFPLIILSTYAFFFPVWRVINEALLLPKVSTVLNFGYSGGVYGIYITLGYCVKKGMLKSFKTYQVFAISCTFFVLTMLLQMFSYAHGKTYNTWYDSGFLMICTLFLFEGFSRIQFRGNQSWWNWLSQNSFGIYLIHFPFILLLDKWMKALPAMLPIKVTLFLIIILLISISICWCVNQFPKLSKVLLYNR